MESKDLLFDSEAIRSLFGSWTETVLEEQAIDETVALSEYENPDTELFTQTDSKVQYISEFIGDEFRNWNGRSVVDDGEQKEILSGIWHKKHDEEGDFISIDSGTGTGKTHFIFNILAPYAAETDDKILYLCNRTTLKTDAERIKNLSNVTNVDIETYQKIQNVILKSRKTIEDNGTPTNRYQNEYLKLWSYKYIVADEMHYFLEDSAMNPNIFYIYRFLMQKIPQIKILISATGKYAKSTFSDNIKYPYSIDGDKSYIKMHFYKDDRSNGIDFPLQKIKEILREDEDSKIIYFVDTKSRIDKIWEENEDLREHIQCMFSDSQDDPHSIRENECIHFIDEDTVTFNKRVLLTTSILSNGVSLKDNRIKYIICDIKDVLTATQCVGRKRTQNPEDTCDVYLKYHYMEELQPQWVKAYNKYRAAATLVNCRDTFCSQYGDFCSEDLSDCYIIDWLSNGIIQPNIPRIEYYWQQTQIFQKMDSYEHEENKTDDKPAYGYRKALGYYSGISDVSDVIALDELEDPFVEELIEYIDEFPEFDFFVSDTEVKGLKDICKKYKRLQKNLGKILSEKGYNFRKIREGHEKKTRWIIEKL